MGDLIQTFEQGIALVVVDPGGFGDGEVRVVAALKKVDGGLIFADAFWNLNEFHPFHFLSGEVSGKGPWDIGGIVIRQLEHGEGACGIWNGWVDAKESNAYLTPANALKHAKNTFPDLL
jgi:hypothetical protein